MNPHKTLIRQVIQTPPHLRRARKAKNKFLEVEKIPQIIKLGNGNSMIQPRYMQNGGSMCLTELWIFSQKTAFKRDANKVFQVLVAKNLNYDIAGPFRPGHYQQAKEVYDKASVRS